jgi:peptide subunit release factor 1 (eRF1)
VPVITEEVIRSLAGFRAEQAPVTSCYLDVDGKRLARFQDVEHEMEILLHDARGRANGHRSVHADLSRIEEFVRAGFDRSNTRGLAFFACAAHDLWEVIALPVPVQSRVVINHVPAVSQLELVASESEPIGVLLVDRQRARAFVYELGQLTDHSELFDELPRAYDTRGDLDYGDRENHVDAIVRRHLRRAADAAFQLFQQHAFSHLALAMPEELTGELESLLHPYLQQRLRGRFSLPLNASADEIRQLSIEVEMAVEQERIAAELDRLREAVATGRRGVAGLPKVLEALNDKRVELLLVSRGFVDEGWRCPDCLRLALVGRGCKACGASMDEVDDIVEEAIDTAVAQRAQVRICTDNADLDCLGRIGALLRY